MPDKAPSPGRPAVERIVVGAIAGSFGVHGEVRLKSFCAVPEAIADYGPLWTEDGARSFAVRLTRPVSGVATKEAADALRGTSLFADKARLPRLPDDEFYHADLIGLAVRDAGGAEVGRVTAVHNHGAGDLLEVSGPRLKDALLLPFTKLIVPTVDLAAGIVVVDLPEGLDGG